MRRRKLVVVVVDMRLVRLRFAPKALCRAANRHSRKPMAFLATMSMATDKHPLLFIGMPATPKFRLPQ